MIYLISHFDSLKLEEMGIVMVRKIQDFLWDQSFDKIQIFRHAVEDVSPLDINRYGR